MAEKKDLMSRLKDFEVKELDANELVQSILEKEQKRHLVYDLAGTPVKVAAAFPREVRHLIEKRRVSEKPMELWDLEGESYKIMANLCLEAPFNTEQFWAYYDQKTGKFWGVLNAVYSGIERSEEKIGDFRKN